MKTLVISHLAEQKLRAYIDNCETEISGLGKIDITEDGFIITDVTILKQTVTSVHTDIDDDALGKFSYKLVKNGDDIEKWSLWWHSHAKMAAFFSSTDTDTIENSTDHPFLVSLVGNHNGNWEARLDVFKPHHATSKLEVETEILIDDEITKLCKKEIKELVSTETKYQYGSYYKKTNKMGYGVLDEDDWQDDLPSRKMTKAEKKLEKKLRKKGEMGPLSDKEAETASLLGLLGNPQSLN